MTKLMIDDLLYDNSTHGRKLSEVSAHGGVGHLVVTYTIFTVLLAVCASSLCRQHTELCRLLHTTHGELVPPPLGSPPFRASAWSRVMWFGEEICRIVGTTDVLEFDGVVLDELTNPEILDGNILGNAIVHGLSRMRIVAMLS